MSPAAPTPTVTANAADPLLAKWVHLYDQLEATRAMLKAAPQGPAAVELKDEIRRLQRLAGAALEMVAAEQERERSGRKS